MPKSSVGIDQAFTQMKLSAAFFSSNASTGN